MKVLILVCLIFAAGCQGGFLDSLKLTLKQVGGAFTETFKQVGVSLDCPFLIFPLGFSNVDSIKCAKG
jgi:hypothetical protein